MRAAIISCEADGGAPVIFGWFANPNLARNGLIGDLKPDTYSSAAPHFSQADFWTTSGSHPESKRAVYDRSAHGRHGGALTPPSAFLLQAFHLLSHRLEVSLHLVNTNRDAVD